MAQKILELVEWLDRWFFKKINILTSFSDPLTDTKVPSEKLVKNSLDAKVDKEQGKGLSTNDYDNVAKTKVDNLKNIATTGSYHDLIDVPENNDIEIDEFLDANSNHPVTNSAIVAEFNSHTHSYNDLTDRPTITGSGEIIDFNFGFNSDTKEIYLELNGE